MTRGDRTVIARPGERFGYWTVIGEAPPVKYGSQNGVNRRWMVRCDCGRVTTTSPYHLRYGSSTGCRPCRTADRYAVEIDGEPVRLRVALARSGVSQSLFNKRVERGWSRERAATTPTQTHRRAP